nr:MAG TPA: Thymidylate synthase complementing protein [Caudoviricetes sp.]
MGIKVHSQTTKKPYELIGEMMGVCYGSNTTDPIKNRRRGKEGISAGHGRVLEFPQIYLIMDEYSAKVMREFYTHIGGDPTRLQASTRYIKYGDFDYVTPPNIKNNGNAKEIYDECMETISSSIRELESLGIPKEDASGLLPLNYKTVVVCRTNLRMLIDMSHQRDCSRAYWEFRNHVMKDLEKALSEYDEEYAEIVNEYFKPKCEVMGYCEETRSCGRKPKRAC